MKEHKINFSKLKKENCNGKTLKNVDLSNYTTFKIGGKAKYFLEISTLEGFIKVMLYLEKVKYPYFVIGNGSNLLVSDKGFDGVVIKFSMDFDKLYLFDNCIECGAGVLLSKVYKKCYELGFSGFEDSALIPGSVGGAVFMNASAYDFEISKLVDYVVAYENGKITYFSNDECRFGYRDSIFQHNGSIILRVCFKFETKNKDEIKNRYLEVAKKRKENQPLNCFSAGSVFRKIDNIVVSKYLDNMGIKGMSIGGAMVSLIHANFIINYSNAKSNDVYLLIQKIKRMFKEKYNLNLNTEIVFLGDFNEVNR